MQQANANLPPKGYANGGWIIEPVNCVGASGRRYTCAEHRPAYVYPRWRAGAHMAGGGNGGAIEVHLHFSGSVGSPYELKNWLAGAFDDLRENGRISAVR